jgi:hypothetical protein
MTAVHGGNGDVQGNSANIGIGGVMVSGSAGFLTATSVTNAPTVLLSQGNFNSTSNFTSIYKSAEAALDASALVF